MSRSQAQQRSSSASALGDPSDTSSSEEGPGPSISFVNLDSGLQQVNSVTAGNTAVVQTFTATTAGLTKIRGDVSARSLGNGDVVMHMWDSTADVQLWVANYESSLNATGNEAPNFVTIGCSFVGVLPVGNVIEMRLSGTRLLNLDPAQVLHCRVVGLGSHLTATTFPLAWAEPFLQQVSEPLHVTTVAQGHPSFLTKWDFEFVL